MYSTCSSGAPAISPSHALAVRCPVPPMMSASELPPSHPERFTISWRADLMSGVLWFNPLSPINDHGAGDHATWETVRPLEEMFLEVLANAGASSIACPCITSVVASD